MCAKCPGDVRKKRQVRRQMERRSVAGSAYGKRRVLIGTDEGVVKEGFQEESRKWRKRKLRKRLDKRSSSVSYAWSSLIIRWTSCSNSYGIYIQAGTINDLFSVLNNRLACMHLKTDQNGTEEPCKIYTMVLRKVTQQ